jgi:hypothetical protein
MLARNQAVSGYKSVCKLLYLKEMVGAKGFEPSTSWSRTRNKNHLSRCPGVSCGFLSRSLLDKFGQVRQHSASLPCGALIAHNCGRYCATGGFLFERFRVALCRESARLMAFFSGDAHRLWRGTHEAA